MATSTRTLDQTSAGDASSIVVRRPTASVMRGALALMSAQPLTWVASLASVIIVPRYLHDAGLGAFAVNWTISGIAGTLGAFGIPSFLTRRIARHGDPAGNAAGAAIIAVTGLSILAAVVVGLAALTINRAAVDPLLLLIGLAGALVYSAQSVLWAALVGQDRVTKFAWLNAFGILGTLATSIAVLVIVGGVYAYAATLVASAFVVTLLAWSLSGLGMPRAAIDPRLWAEFARGGLPFLGWNLALKIRAEIDVVVVGVLLRPHAAGWLAAAYRIINVAVFVPTAITIPLLPALSRLAHDEESFRSTLSKSVTVVLLLTAPLSGAIFASAPALPQLLGWSLEFASSVPLIMILAFQQPLVAVDMVLGAALIALGRERSWLVVAVIAAAVNPIVNLAVVPTVDLATGNGAIGAAFVEFGTELIFLFGALRLMPRGMLDLGLAKRAGAIAAAAAALVAVASWLRPNGLAPALALGGVTFLVVVFALGALRPGEILAFLHEVRRGRESKTVTSDDRATEEPS